MHSVFEIIEMVSDNSSKAGQYGQNTILGSITKYLHNEIFDQ